MTFHPSIATVFGTPYRKPNQRKRVERRAIRTKRGLRIVLIVWLPTWGQKPKAIEP